VVLGKEKGGCMNKTFERVSFLDVPSVTKDDVKEIVRHEINRILDSDWMEQQIAQVLYKKKSEKEKV